VPAFCAEEEKQQRRVTSLARKCETEMEKFVDFDQAIAAHASWKAKLRAYLKKPDHSLKAIEVQSDSKCALGQWIYGEGKRWSATPNYEILRKEHARFHRAAAEVVGKADSGQLADEEVAVGSKSEFMVASAAVVNAITRMRLDAH